MTEHTIRPTRADQRLANAVLHLANALSSNDGFKSAAVRAQAARDLVHDIAFPDHAQKQSSILTVGETQAAIKRIQAKLLQDEADRFDASTKASRQPTPAPAPSCDAPHCACVDGTDCPTIAAGDQLVGDCECHSGADCETPEICAHERAEAAQMPRAIGDGPRRFIVTVDANEVSIDDLDAPPAPDLAARLDGLTAKLDALAERLDGKAGDGTIDNPVLVGAPKVTVSYPFQQEEWTCAPDLRRVKPGRYVRDQKGRVAQVASMMHDTDGTSRLTVDVVDEEG